MTIIRLDLSDGEYINDLWSDSGDRNTPLSIVNDPDPAYAGRKVARCFLDFDKNENGGSLNGYHQHRTEIVPRRTDPIHTFGTFVPGQRNLFGYRIRLAGNFAKRDGHGNIITQWHLFHFGGGGGGPCLSMRPQGDIGNDGTFYVMAQGKNNTTGASGKVDGTLKKPGGQDWLISEWVGRWVTVVWDVFWSYQTDGLAIVYVDGAEAIRLAGRNCDNDGSYLKVGHYLPGWRYPLNQGDQCTDPGQTWKGTYNGIRTREHLFGDFAIASGEHEIEEVTPPGPTDPDLLPPPETNPPTADPTALLVSTGFTAANDTLVTAVVPTIDVEAGGFFGDATIQSNALGFAGFGDWAAIDSGSRNHRVRVKWTANGANNRAQILLRASNVNASFPDTGYVLTIRTDQHEVQFGEITNATNTVMAQVPYTMDITATYEAVADIVDDRIRLWMIAPDGFSTLVIDQMNALHASGTGIQLRHVNHDATGGRFDDLRVYGENSEAQPLINVQQLQVVIPAGQVTHTVTTGFAPVADITKASLSIRNTQYMGTGSSTGLTMGQALREVAVTPAWNGTSEIVLTRHEASSEFDTQVQIEICESLVTGDDGFTVLERGILAVSGLTAQTAVAIPGVTDVTRVWLRKTGVRYDGNGNSPRNLNATLELTVDDKVLATRGNSAGTVTVGYEAIQFGVNYTVVSHEAEITSTGVVNETTLPATIDWAQTYKHIQVRATEGRDIDSEIHAWAGSAGNKLKLFRPSNAIGAAFVRAWLVSHPLFTAQHLDSIDGGQTSLPAQAGNRQVVDRSLQGPVSATERALVSATAGNSASSTVNPSAAWDVRLLNADAVRFIRARGDSLSRFTATVVDMAEGVIVDPGIIDPPTPPGEPKVTVISATTVTAKWSESHSEVGVAEYGYSLDGAAIVWTGSTSLSVGIFGLDIYTEYTFSAYAKDTGALVSELGDVVTFRTRDIQPTVPGNTSAESLTSSALQVSSSGSTSASGIDHYLVEVDAVMREDQITDFPHTIQSLPTPDRDYVIRLYAVNVDGLASNPTQEFTGRTLATPTVPTAGTHSFRVQIRRS